MQVSRIKEVLSAFDRHQVKYKLVGAVAMSFQGVIRATEDLDVFVGPDRENIERLKGALRDVYADPNIDQISADDLLGEYPAIQYVPPDGIMPIDLLVRLGEAFDYDAIDAEEKIVDGLRVVVATPKMLVRMKRDTVRLQDKADAERLREVFGIEDE